MIAGWTWDEFTLVAGFSDGGLLACGPLLWVGVAAGVLLAAWVGFLVAALLSARQRGGMLDMSHGEARAALDYAHGDTVPERRRLGT